jgi:ADP-ribosylglycohydrolase
VISTLETALHIGLNCGNIENGMITAVNQGGDTDTITAITGAIAGARFGAAFPLLKREDIWLKLKKNKIADLEREEDTIPYRWSKKIKINTDENEMSAFNYARIRADELLERPHIMSQFDNNRN